MRLRTPLVIAATAALLGASALPAMAAETGGTNTTFSLTGGALALAVAPSATLTAGASGATAITGTLGAVTVTDARGGTAGWVTSAISTAFTGTVTGTPSTAVSYNSNTVTPSGAVTATSAGQVSVIGAVAVVSATAVTGNNTATWNPTLSVTLPSTSLATTYSGTVTTSIL